MQGGVVYIALVGDGKADEAWQRVESIGNTAAQVLARADKQGKLTLDIADAMAEERICAAKGKRKAA